MNNYNVNPYILSHKSRNRIFVNRIIEYQKSPMNTFNINAFLHPELTNIVKFVITSLRLKNLFLNLPPNMHPLLIEFRFFSTF